MIFHALTDPSFPGLDVLADSFPIGFAIPTFCFPFFQLCLAKWAELALMGLETFLFLALVLRNAPAEFFEIGFAGAFSSCEGRREGEQCNEEKKRDDSMKLKILKHKASLIGVNRQKGREEARGRG